MTQVAKLCAVAIALTLPSTAEAWNARGHMAVVAVAWDHMTPSARARATTLLKLNPNYPRWTNGMDARDRDVVTFVKAATWPDEIRSDQRYEDDGYEPEGPTANQNIGYSDVLLHRYWHFKDRPFSPDGTATEEPFEHNAVSQIQAFSDALGSAHVSDDIKSYDLAWLLHLVGDIHQPLHATSRFTASVRHGDNGGNGVKICSETARLCDLEHASSLHSFWDGAVGTSNLPLSAVSFSKRLPRADATRLVIADPNLWAEESFMLAGQAAYVDPIGTNKGPYRLTRSYRTVVGSVAERRIALAGERWPTCSTPSCSRPLRKYDAVGSQFELFFRNGAARRPSR